MKKRPNIHENEISTVIDKHLGIIGKKEKKIEHCLSVLKKITVKWIKRGGRSC